MAATATRQAFGDALVKVGSDPRVVVIDGDTKNSTFTELFAEQYPDRFIELGIAENNMLGVAAGLALSGKIPWAATFSTFIVGRLEVVRMSVCYNEANVRIAGTHVGVGIGDDGASQMALEDIAALRALPNMAIVQPCDSIETHHAVEYLTFEHVGPAFLRLTRQKLEDVHQEGYRFVFGKADQLRQGTDVTLIATGALVQEALAAAKALDGEGVSAGVLNIHTIAPLDVDAIVGAARSTGRIVSAEDHNVNGGLGSAVAEAIAEAGIPARLVRVGTRAFGESGSQEELYDRFGLSATHVADAARSLMG
ncbi:MAG: transketolase family protein [Actinomycetota bacterium]|nr:transketolase family protein [Actinomycetota bacterium]